MSLRLTICSRDQSTHKSFAKLALLLILGFVLKRFFCNFVDCKIICRILSHTISQNYYIKDGQQDINRSTIQAT